MQRRDLTFRVFVSSTFSDLVAERNALQEHVFPRLRELCWKHGAQFQAIDLRWGVSEEASLDQQTMNICLEELHRCRRTTPRPNFIVLLGQRYGWCPLPPQVDGAEFESLLAALPDPGQQRLKQWYRRDDNAVPAEYCLQAREGRFKDRAAWATEERELRVLLREAIVRVGWTAGDARRLKYEASATHQEILHGALQVADTIDHVFGFFRTIEGLRQDGTAGDFLDLDPQGRPDAEAGERLARLQAELRTRLPNNIHTWSAAWTGNGPSTGHLGTLPTDLEACQAMRAEGYEPRNLCEAVWCRLGRVMLEEVQRRDHSDPVDQEAIAHSTFGHDRARHFIGREDALARIREYVQEDNRQPLVLYGVSGVGKSALMAKAAGQTSEVGGHRSEVIVRYIGATPASSDLRALLEGLCKEITLRYGGDAASVPMDVRKLELDFPQRLALATADKPLVVFLDALDQLSSADGARHLGWLPRELPPHVKLVVSVLSRSSRGNEAQTPGDPEPPHVGSYSSEDVEDLLAVLRGRLPAEAFVRIEPLNADCGAPLLEAWLTEARRTLQPQQRQEVLEKFAANGLPLYLKLAFEEARRWKSWGPFGVPPSGGPDRVNAELPAPDSLVPLSPDVDGLIERLFNRLSEPANHGPLLVERAISYLRCSRHGLSEDEMLDILANDSEYCEHFRQSAHHALPVTEGQQPRRLPVVVWSRLYHDLEPYLSWRSADGVSLMVFFHTRFNEVADREFLRDETVRSARHERLATYFNDQDNFLESLEEQRARPKRLPPTPRPSNVRKVDELPWQLTKISAWKRLFLLLSDLGFTQAAILNGRFDLLTYWAQVETRSSFRMVDAYRVVLEDPDGHNDYAWELSSLLFDRGHMKECSLLREHLLLQCRGTGDRMNLPGAMENVAISRHTRGDLDGALELFKKAEEQLRLDESPSLARNLLNQATALRDKGQPHAAMRCIDEAKRLLVGSRDDALVVQLLGTEGLILWELGDFDAADSILEKCEQKCLEAGDLKALQKCLCNRSLVDKARGDVEFAVHRCRRAESICRELGYQQGLQACLGNLANLLLYQKKFREALALQVEKGILCRGLGIKASLATALGNQAAILAELGRYGEAVQIAAEAYNLAASINATVLAGRMKEILDFVSSRNV